MSDINFEKTVDQASAFQKIWTDSMSKMMQSAFTCGPNSPPPEILREIRSGIFQALAQSWEEFMRSPQFVEGMKQWMDSAINFRKMSNDFMAKVRNEMQAPSREDMDSIMLSVRHMENGCSTASTHSPSKFPEPTASQPVGGPGEQPNRFEPVQEENDERGPNFHEPLDAVAKSGV